MKTIRFFLLCCMVVAVSACTPFYRGFEGSTLVSPARPDVSVSVADMPMLAHGQIKATSSRKPLFPYTVRMLRLPSLSWPFPLCQTMLGNGTP